MKIDYTFETLEFIKMLDKFNKEEFEKWFLNYPFDVGSNNILMYLKEKDRWNTDPILRKTLLNIKFSVQSLALLDYITDFNADNFRIWYSNSVAISKDIIITFLENKKVKFLKECKNG